MAKDAALFLLPSLVLQLPPAFRLAASVSANLRSMPVRLSTTGGRTRVGAWTGALTFVLIGAAAIAWGISINREYRDSERWPTTQAYIDRAEARHVGGRNNNGWEIRLDYHFDVAGQHYAGTRLQPRRNTYPQSSKQFAPDLKWVQDHHASGQSVPCLFDPRDPRRCFLFRRATSGGGLIAFGVVFILCAPALVLIQRQVASANSA